jgi:hypothetical protein
MSEREFEHYLTLLGSMLRLRPEQRAEIAEELQQHLDERLDDLQAAGLSRDEAIQQALAEFGDAAGLAAQFSSVSRRRYRRWMMRAATASVTTAFMVIVLFVSFWPMGGRVPLAQPMTAQDTVPPTVENSADAGDPFAKSASPALDSATTVSSTREAKNAETRRMIETIEAPELNGMSISDLANELGLILPHGCLVDRKSLEENGVDPDAGDIQWHLTNASLGTMLEIALDEMELTYQIRDGIMIITSSEAAREDLSLVIYDAEFLFGSFVIVEQNLAEDVVRQLVNSRPLGQPAGDIDALRISVERFMEKYGPREEEQRFNRVANLIQSQIDPNSWEENGGAGTISSVGTRLVARQTERAHRKIRKLLDDLAATNDK